MKRLIRELRIVPVVIMAASCLLALKLIGLGLDGGYILSEPSAGTASEPVAVQTVAAASSPEKSDKLADRPSWAQEMFGYPETTGSVPDKKAGDKDRPPASNPKPVPINPPKDGIDGTLVPINGPPQPPPGEQAVLQHLQERRQELDARARELDIRESLLQAAEKRLETRAAEVKDTEARIANTVQQDGAAANTKLKSIAVMYENMKAKDAAKVFDRLDLKILLDIASLIDARRLADIVAQMQPENAERLTVALANRANGKAPGFDLPKIEGRPNNP